MIPFRKTRSGAIVARFTPVEAELLSTLAMQLIELLSEVAAPGDDPLPGLVIGGSTDAPTDPALARLFPDAYADDEAAASEFRQLTERGLAGRKTENARFVFETARSGRERVELDRAGADRWMRSIGDIRLTIAARLGIVDEESPIADDDEPLAMYEVYNWLAGVQDSLVRALSR